MARAGHPPIRSGRRTWRVRVSEWRLPVADLGEPLSGIRVAHVSDVHFPAGRVAAQHVEHHLAGLKPEIVAVTGDLVGARHGLPDALAFLERIRGTVATVAVMGNWEYALGLAPDQLRSAYAEVGVELLVNACSTIDLDGAALNIVGLDDPVGGAPDPGQAAAACLRDAPSVWLVHTPGIADDAAVFDGAKPTLILAGHTHGGQIRVPGLRPPVLPSGCGRFISGYYPDAVGPLYVSRGIGTSGVPFRLWCPAELPVFTLERDTASDG